MHLRHYLDRFTLGSYLAAMLAAFMVALTVVIVAVVGIKAAAQIRASISQHLAELAFQTTDKLDRGMFERYREVQLMAERTLFGDPQASADAKRNAIEQMQRTYPTYAWIGMTDLNGTVLVATGKMLENASVAKRPWFGGALNNQYLHDVHDAVLLARLLPNPTNEPKRFLTSPFPTAINTARWPGYWAPICRGSGPVKSNVR